MRWTLVLLEGLATGLFATLASFVSLVMALHVWTRYVVGMGPNQVVGWDPISLFGSHWRLFVAGIPAVIFVFGFSAGFWFFSKRMPD